MVSDPVAQVRDGWPTVSILIGAATDGAATRHTADSVRAGDYRGEIQLLIGGEAASMAAIANAHATEAAGSLLMILPPGATLDPRCLRRLVERIQADQTLMAVAPKWRGPDGTALEPGSYSSADPEIRPLLGQLQQPAAAGTRWHPFDLSPLGSMLIRTERFSAVGGYDLTLDDSSYGNADLGRRLAGTDGYLDIEAGAVAFAPSAPTGLHRLPAYRLVPAGGHSFQPTTDLSPQAGSRTILWVTAHLPDRDRSGIDARHLEMIEGLAADGAQVVVWAEHHSGARPAGRQLAAQGVRWIAPPADQRWNLKPARGPAQWLGDLLGGVSWDVVVIAEPRLAGWVIPQVRALAPDSRVLVDFGTVRFPAAHAPGFEFNRDDAADELPAIEAPDAVVVATHSDRMVVERLTPDLPAFVFGALGAGDRTTTKASAFDELLFVGDLFHHPNLLALEWWMDSVAARVQARVGRPAPLRVVGHGSDVHRAVWNHPDKIQIAGWRPDLTAEFARARALVVPLTMVTGTGGRIASALAHGVPVVAAAPAAAVLAPPLARLVRIGKNAGGLADQIGQLMGDDAAWEADRAAIAAADLAGLRQGQVGAFSDWLAGVQLVATDGRRGDDRTGRSSRTPRIRPSRRRRRRAS